MLTETMFGMLVLCVIAVGLLIRAFTSEQAPVCSCGKRKQPQVYHVPFGGCVVLYSCPECEGRTP